MKKSIILLLVGLAIIVGIQDFYKKKSKFESPKPRPYIVMLSLDGFRWDYQEKAETPTLDSITKYGVSASGLQPSFPSLDLPNKYTIATGLNPGNHGIISNSFYNFKLKEYYSKTGSTNIDKGEFYIGEPIWVTAEAQNVKTGSFFWVGSDAKIKGYRPSYWKNSNIGFSNTQKVDTIVSWLQKPYKKRPKLITWSIKDVYEVSSKSGSESDEVKNTIATIDSLVGYFMKQTNSLNIKDSINFIIVSNHGMADVNTQKTVYINNLLNKNWVDTVLAENQFLLVYPEKKCTDSILNSLIKTEGIKAWAKKDIPNRFFLKNSVRVPEIVVVANKGWNICVNTENISINKGTSGYDNIISDMNGVFYAIGPNFKKDYKSEQLYNTDIYNLLARILEIKAAPNDGKDKRIMHVLK